MFLLNGFTGNCLETGTPVFVKWVLLALFRNGYSCVC